MDYLAPKFDRSSVDSLSVLALAHVGDSVFELLVRTFLASEGHTASLELHRITVSMVNASAQHAFFERIQPVLSGEELSVYRRGRNAKVNSVPHNATKADYHSATGLETLFGWLYLNGMNDRINELFALATAPEQNRDA